MNSTDESTTPPPQWPQYEGMIYPAEKAYQLLMIFGSLLSLLASMGVLLEMLADQRSGRGTSVTRVLFFAMIGIILHNFGKIWGTLPSPEIYQDFNTVGMPRGNTITCTIQGFLIYFGSLVSLGWDIVLSVTYVLMMCYNWTPAKLWRMERVGHAFVWLLSLGPAVAALVTENYNQDEQFCFAVAEPEDCDGVEIPCLRGSGNGVYLIIVQVVVIVAITASGAAMLMLYAAVRRLEERNKRYASHPSASVPHQSQVSHDSAADAPSVPSPPQQQHSAEAHKRSRKVGVQGILFTGTLVVTTTPLVTAAMVWEFSGKWNIHVYSIASVITSLNGVCVYWVLQRHRAEMKTWYGRHFRRVFLLLFCSCCWNCPLKKGGSKTQTTIAARNANVESMGMGCHPSEQRAQVGADASIETFEAT